jgi:hypothetical protein
MDRAEKLGLTSRKGENWKRQPIAMLIARATSECARLVAPETLLGLPYSAEELADGAFDDAAPDMPAANGKAPARRTAQRRRQPETPPPPTTLPAPAAAAPEDEPPLDDQPAPAKPAADEPPPTEDITTAQLQSTPSRIPRHRHPRPQHPPRNHPANHRPAHQQRHPTHPREASTVIDGLNTRRTQQAQQAEDPPAVVDVPLPDADTWHGDDDTTPFRDEPKN